MTGSQLADFYADLCANYPLITIEDPFDQAGLPSANSFDCWPPRPREIGQIRTG